MSRNIRSFAFLPAALLFAAVSPSRATVVLPTGFFFEPVVTGPFTGGTVGFAFLPDGRPLLLELGTGVVRLSAVGSSVADSIAQLPGVRADHPERGLLGVAVDPAWPKRPYLYFQYTHVDGFERVEMWSASGALTDPSSTSISLSSPYVLLGDIEDVNGIHNAGTLRFGPDGRLYSSVGEDGIPCLSQDVTGPNGKLLRLDVSRVPQKGPGPPPIEDLVPPGNPRPEHIRYAPLVYAWGLRNPFRFTVDAPTGNVLIGDVGEAWYDEIDFIPGAGYRGYDFGWPMFDGTRRIHCCDSCNTAAAVMQAVHLVPNAPESLLAVTGGPVIRAVPASPISFPASLDGDYFYFEFFAGSLHHLREAAGKWDYAPALPGQPSAIAFGLGLPSVTDAQLGPDGALYFVSLGLQGALLPRGLYRIGHDSSRQATSVSAGGDERHVVALRVAPNPSRAGVGVTVRLRGGTTGEVRVEILDAAGARVRTIEHASAAAGEASMQWDGKDAAGRLVPGGVYLVRVTSALGGVVGVGKVTLLR
ncbi:MAG: PQQ-dependent sugar dehydrogenase [bacterium]